MTLRAISSSELRLPLKYSAKRFTDGPAARKLGSRRARAAAPRRGHSPMVMSVQTADGGRTARAMARQVRAVRKRSFCGRWARMWGSRSSGMSSKVAGRWGARACGRWVGGLTRERERQLTAAHSKPKPSSLPKPAGRVRQAGRPHRGRGVVARRHGVCWARGREEGGFLFLARGERERVSGPTRRRGKKNGA